MSRSLDSLRAFVAGSSRDTSHRVHPGTVVFGAGKGGVGTSAAAALVALAAARRGASVLLVDAEETVGSLHLMFGFGAESAGAGLAAGTAGPGPATCWWRPRPGLALFPGGGGGVDATLAVAQAERRMLLRRVAELYDRYDLVVVDGGSRLDSVMAACAAGAGRVAGVTTSERIAQAAVYALLKVVRGRFGDLPVELVVNGAADAAAREVHGMVQAASSSFLGSGVAFGGSLPEDAELRRALAVGDSLAGCRRMRRRSMAAGTLADRLLAEMAAAGALPAPVVPIHAGAPLGR